MQKKEMSAILARASKEELDEIAARIEAECKVEILKEPQKTLVMVKARESIRRSLFYLGEVLETECIVVVNGTKGYSVVAGDNEEQCLAAAIIDAAVNADLDQVYGISEKLQQLKTQQEKKRARLNAEILKSKVNFNVMGE